METKTMQSRALAFLLSEASGHRSRSTATIAAGAGVLEAGTVLGVVTATGEFAPSPAAETYDVEGAETAVAILGYGVDATDAPVTVAIVDRDAEVKRPELRFHASVDDQTKIDAKVAQLGAADIRAR
jgi:hypothetical protein